MPGLPEHVRLFTAVEIDLPIRRAVREQAVAFLRDAGKVSLVPEANLHVTLKFIGEVHRDDLGAVDETVADGVGGEGAERLREGEITVEEIGGFPNLARPRVIWAGVSDPEGILTPVYARLNETLARFGAKREKKRYVPHVTVARVRGRFDGDLFSERIANAGRIWFGTQPVARIVLMMSELGRGGPPTYTVVGHYGGSADGDG